jgi:hypothetical protein
MGHLTNTNITDAFAAVSPANDLAMAAEYLNVTCRALRVEAVLRGLIAHDVDAGLVTVL